jgi:hypothetical protein
LVPTLFRAYNCHYSLACVLALHFKLTCKVCFFSPRIHQTTNASGGDENDLQPGSPWQPLSWSALRLRTLHCFLSAGSSYWIDLMSLSLTAVRATIERGGMKDWRTDCRRSQKVISSQGDTSPPWKTPVCIWKASPPSGNAKIGYKTHSPPWPKWSPVSRVPLYSPICSLSLLLSPTKFSTNKIFLTSAVSLSVLSFSEQAQEPWAPEIPACVISASLGIYLKECNSDYNKMPWKEWNFVIAGKWMELKNIILIKVSQVQKTRNCMFLLHVEHWPYRNIAILWETAYAKGRSQSTERGQKKEV